MAEDEKYDNVQECSSASCKHKEWCVAVKKGEPLVIIMKDRKYAQFHYDFFTCKMALSQEGVKKCEELILNYVDGLPKGSAILPKRCWWGFGNSIGYGPKMLLSECRVISKQLKSIVSDNQVVSIFRGS
jgi:hypothetical protein